MEEQNEGIILSDHEKTLIEAQRREIEAVEVFKTKYNELVQNSGFAWVVDITSPINSPKLGISKIR
jgi:hypothetical protein